MGIVPLQFVPGESIAALGLTGREVFDILGLAEGIENGFAPDRKITIRATREDGSVLEFKAIVRIDTPQEIHYYRHGGILQYVLRRLVKE
jgi:aconitate hydratase